MDIRKQIAVAPHAHRDFSDAAAHDDDIDGAQSWLKEETLALTVQGYSDASGSAPAASEAS